MTENKVKHLEFIQNIISRMNQNSFQLKGWMITVVSALLALYASSNSIRYLWIAILPVILFWLVDSYYLQQERKFIGMYNEIVKEKEKNIKDFELPLYRYKGEKYCYFKVLISKTEAGLYAPIILGLVIVGILLK